MKPLAHVCGKHVAGVVSHLPVSVPLTYQIVSSPHTRLDPLKNRIRLQAVDATPFNHSYSVLRVEVKERPTLLLELLALNT